MGGGGGGGGRCALHPCSAQHEPPAPVCLWFTPRRLPPPPHPHLDRRFSAGPGGRLLCGQNSLWGALLGAHPDQRAAAAAAAGGFTACAVARFPAAPPPLLPPTCPLPPLVSHAHARSPTHPPSQTIIQDNLTNFAWASYPGNWGSGSNTTTTIFQCWDENGAPPPPPPSPHAPAGCAPGRPHSAERAREREHVAHAAHMPTHATPALPCPPPHTSLASDHAW